MIIYTTHLTILSKKGGRLPVITYTCTLPFLFEFATYPDNYPDFFKLGVRYVWFSKIFQFLISKLNVQCSKKEESVEVKRTRQIIKEQIGEYITKVIQNEIQNVITLLRRLLGLF